MVGQFLATGDDSRLVESGKPHCLRLKEFGVLECPKAKQPVQHRGRKILLFDIQEVAANNLDLHRKGAGYWTLCSLSGWWQRPRILPLIFRRADSHSDKVSTRWASRPTASAAGMGIRFMLARKVHWSPYGRNPASMKTLFPSARGSLCRDSAIKLPSPPFGMVSWLGKKRSYESSPSR